MKKWISKDSNVLQEEPLINKEDLYSSLAEKKEWTSLFLGKYSMNEMISVLSKRSLVKEAKKRNLFPLKYDLDSSEFPVQRFRIYCKKKKPENLIVDLKIKEGTFRPLEKLRFSFSLHRFDLLILEWLTLQNPLVEFSKKKPPLPGQKYPSLGLGRKVFSLFVYLARLTRKDGLMAFPAYFHNAILFSRRFFFLNPEKQGEVFAIRKAFRDVSLNELAWIIHWNCLKMKNGKIYEWKAEEQIYPIRKSLRKFFYSKKYKDKVKASSEKLDFEIDWDCYKRKLKEKKI